MTPLLLRGTVQRRSEEEDTRAPVGDGVAVHSVLPEVAAELLRAALTAQAR